MHRSLWYFSLFCTSTFRLCEKTLDSSEIIAPHNNIVTARRTQEISKTSDPITPSTLPRREFMTVSDVHVAEYIKHLYQGVKTSSETGTKNNTNMSSDRASNPSVDTNALPPGKSRKNLSPLSEILPGLVEGIETSYRFQERVIAIQQQRGVSVIAWKTGATAQVVQKQWNFKNPVHAPIFSTALYKEGDEISMSQHRIQSCEMNFAFRIAKTLSLEDLSGDASAEHPGAKSNRLQEKLVPIINPTRLLEYVDEFYPSIEFSGTRFAHRAPHGPAFVADMIGNAAIALGSGFSIEKWRNIDLASYNSVLFFEEEPIQTGKGENVLGNPLNSIVHLAHNFAYMRNQRKLTPGTIILTGGCGQQPNLVRTGRITSHFGPMGKVVVNIVT